MQSAHFLSQERRNTPSSIRDGLPEPSPAIFAPGVDNHTMMFSGLPQGADQDQLATQRLLAMSPPQLQIASAPDPSLNSFFFSPIPESDTADTDLSLSPAAMFLSSFSPMVAPKALPDDEGESVAGYVLGPIVGHGGFSIIRRASSPQGGVVAVKIVRRSDIAKQEDPEFARSQLQHEGSVWSSLNHEHILPLFTSSHSDYADFFITLYCPAGSLFDILKRDGRPALPQDEAGRMYRQVVKGVRYMHEVAGYVHGDLKLENVMVDEMGVCRIGDFGMAKRIGESESDDDEDRPSVRARGIRTSKSVRQKRSRSRTQLQHVIPSHANLLRHHSGPRHRNSSPLPTTSHMPHQQVYQPGSLPYASPELLLPSASSSPYRPHPAQDVWALGVMLYVLLTGRMPFADSFEPRLQMKILNGVYDMPSGIGRGAERVLQGSLERSVPDRWTIDMVDEVAWGIGWGDAGDEAPSPTDMLPPARSHSSARPPTVLEEVVADDPTPPHLPPIKTSRASRSRSRLAAYHPYPENPNYAHDGHPFVPRSKSSSISSESRSPHDQVDLRSPSTSVDRGRGRRTQPSRTSSRSGSPPETLLTPVDEIMGHRGRKPSPRTMRTIVSGLAKTSFSPEGSDISPDNLWAARSASAEGCAYPDVRAARPQSRDTRTAGRRNESVPPFSQLSQSWQVPKGLSTAKFTPVSVAGMTVTPRSRSVGFSDRRPHKLERAD